MSSDSQSQIKPSHKHDAWWSIYLQHLSTKGVNEKHLPWYRRRIEELLKQYPRTKSKGFLATDIDGYLTALDGIGLEAWQLTQTVDALQRFAAYTHAPWATVVNWRKWQQCFSNKASSQDQVIIETQGVLPEESSMRTFVVRMRVMRYQLRTEQSYCQWVFAVSNTIGSNPPLSS